MRECKHVCDITLILIGYVLSDARFDWLVVNMEVSGKSISIKKEINSNFLPLSK